MENITLDQIDLIIERANVTYSEAKEALEHANGDMLEALLYLEKLEKIKPTKQQNSCKKHFVNFINKLNATSFILKKENKTFVNVPLSVALIAFILCLHISIIALVLAVIFGVKIQIKGDNSIADTINNTLGGFTKG